MNKDFSFKVVLVKIHEQSLEAKEAISSLLAAILNIPEQETQRLLDNLPVVLFEKVTTADFKALKDQLIFLSKLGLDFTITPKALPDVPRTGWSYKSAMPVLHCPSCGESFCLVRVQDFLDRPRRTENKIVMPHQVEHPAVAPAKRAARPQNEELGAISAEFDEVEVLSAELQSIVDMEDNPNASEVDEIEEVGSISEELEEIGSVSEELEQLEDVVEELEEIGDVAEELNRIEESSSIHQEERSRGGISEIESLGGISAEFEEIEGVSAEFEGIVLDDMDNDIGSLSAELEEIEGISAEFESIDEEDLEKVDEISDGFNHIAVSDSGRESGDDHELEELEGISQELDEIGRPQKFSEAESGNYKVMVDFSSAPKLEEAARLTATLAGISYQEALQLAQKHSAIIVASNVSSQAAQKILAGFQALGMQGRVFQG